MGNSQVIANRIDHHQLQYKPKCKRTQNVRTNVVPKEIPGGAWFEKITNPGLTCQLKRRSDQSTGLAQKPCNSQISPECQSPPVKLTRRDMGREILPPKIFPPFVSHDLASLSLLRQNYAFNLSHFVTNFTHNPGASLAYIFVL